MDRPTPELRYAHPTQNPSEPINYPIGIVNVDHFDTARCFFFSRFAVAHLFHLFRYARSYSSSVPFFMA